MKPLVLGFGYTKLSCWPRCTTTLQIIKAVGKNSYYSPHTDRNASLPKTKDTQFIEYGGVELVHILSFQFYVLGSLIRESTVHTQNISRYTVGISIFAPSPLYIHYVFQFDVFIKLLSM